MASIFRIPPPPSLAKADPVLNRWLIELTSILNGDGSGVNGGAVSGFAALQSQVATATTNITALQQTDAAQNGQVSTLQNQMVGVNSSIATLQARNQILNGSGAPLGTLGNNGDLYFNNTGASGSRLYGKVSGAWVVIA